MLTLCGLARISTSTPVGRICTSSQTHATAIAEDNCTHRAHSVDMDTYQALYDYVERWRWDSTAISRGYQVCGQNAILCGQNKLG